MRPPRLTIRRLMVAVAIAGIILAAIVEVPRLKRRWDHCQEKALIHGQWSESNRLEEQKQSGRLGRANSILRRWETLGPERLDLDSLIEASGDAQLAGWFFKDRGRIELLYGYDPWCPYDQWAAGTGPSKGVRVSPQAAARFVQELWVAGWSEPSRSRGQWARYHASRREEFLRAAWRPWLPIPPESSF